MTEKGKFHYLISQKLKLPGFLCVTNEDLFSDYCIKLLHEKNSAIARENTSKEGKHQVVSVDLDIKNTEQCRNIC